MKKIISFLAACTFILCPLTSCDKKNENSDSSEYIEGYTYNQEEFNPEKGSQNNDQQTIDELTDVFNTYFRGTNNKNAKVELTAYTPKAYVQKLKDENKYQNFLLSIDATINQEHNQWSEYGDGAMLRLNEITKIFTLNDAFLPKAEKYFKDNFGEFEYDIIIDINLHCGLPIIVATVDCRVHIWISPYCAVLKRLRSQVLLHPALVADGHGVVFVVVNVLHLGRTAGERIHLFVQCVDGTILGGDYVFKAVESCAQFGAAGIVATRCGWRCAGSLIVARRAAHARIAETTDGKTVILSVVDTAHVGVVAVQAPTPSEAATALGSTPEVGVAAEIVEIVAEAIACGNSREAGEVSFFVVISRITTRGATIIHPVGEDNALAILSAFPPH